MKKFMQMEGFRTWEWFAIGTAAITSFYLFGTVMNGQFELSYLDLGSIIAFFASVISLVQRHKGRVADAEAKALEADKQQTALAEVPASAPA